MKKLLLFSLMIMFQSFFGQSFGPMEYHGYSPYTATLSAVGTIYYTTDGTEPTINSASGINNVNIIIDKNTLIKAKVKDSNGTLSETRARDYFYGPIPKRTMYFKPPSNWNSTCLFTNSLDINSTVDVWGPGNNMTPACEGWYKMTLDFFKVLVTFNNCLTFAPPPISESYSVIAEDTIYYDYSAGPISNPPACLLAVNDPSKKIAMVKIFPNPVQDYINIESDKNFIAYEVIDESGKLILNKDFKGSKIDISNLKTGVYFIKLKSLGNETNIVKFIKK
ncbi:T9SS type A sorting domain-containing protein [Epilithonimonas sp. UC225_85]|uniref:T9SS type A sorting domain-containing protein n=1 Tax=Epilithonimonas sp. UC225_85 TaxID=3350167 RepID=UPI0036D30768